MPSPASPEHQAPRAEQAPRATMSVGFLAPLRGGSNPYLRRLAEGIEGAGLRVRSLGTGAMFLHKFLGRSAPDVAHFHWVHPFVISERSKSLTLVKYWLFRAQLAILVRMRKSIVWTAHNLRDHEQRAAGLDWRATSALARRAHAVICHCPAARAQLVEEVPHIDPSRLAVVWHGNYDLDHDFSIPKERARADLGLATDATIVLFFGNVRAYKGIGDLVRAFCATSAERAQLIIAGRPFTPEDESAVREAIGDDARVTFEAGFVETERLDQLLAACDVVALPYRNILSSGAALLAMTFGRAVVCPRIGCFNDLFDESGAVMYDADEERGLSDAIAHAVSSPDTLASMGTRNREEAARVPWKRIGRLTADVYARAARREPVDSIS